MHNFTEKFCFMDILYITQSVEDRIKEFCSEELINYVLKDFNKYAVIVKKEENQHPSRIWVISDYIRNNSIDIINKMNVVLSFIYSGGIIQIDEDIFNDSSNPLAVVKKLGIIDDIQLEVLNDPWFYYNCMQKKPYFHLT